MESNDLNTEFVSSGEDERDTSFKALKKDYQRNAMNEIISVTVYDVTEKMILERGKFCLDHLDDTKKLQTARKTIRNLLDCKRSDLFSYLRRFIR